jgi:hypothetical protein
VEDDGDDMIMMLLVLVGKTGFLGLRRVWLGLLISY